MRHFWLMCCLGVALAMLFLGGQAVAQGCNLAVQNVDFEHECNGVDVPEQYCGGPGTQGYSPGTLMRARARTVARAHRSSSILLGRASA